ncbi:MAG: NfeD family protein [Magnetococcales bacterium]|nr:NfeD family protein [Magnetococcales bacterium]
MNAHFFTFLANLNHWHWGFLAIGLTLLEWVVPQAFFLWLGVAAGTVSGVQFLLPAMGWKFQLLLFLLLALVAVGLSLRGGAVSPVRRVRPPVRAHSPAVTHRASQYVGRLFTLTEPVQDGVGSLQIGHTVWTIYGLDMAAGTQVKVVGFEESILAVEAMEQQTTDPVE